MSTLYKTLSGDKKKKILEEKEKIKNDNESGNLILNKNKNKQHVLLISSRGVTYRQRHLLSDLAGMIPHGRKEPKLDTKSKLYQLNELAELYNCNDIIFFEARKHMDLYMWLAKPPNGPTCKFHIQNLHTQDELNFTGNCLKGSRPILSFDKSFDSSPHYRIVKELLIQTFGVPKGHRKAKPFIDHVLTFTIIDGRIWFRNYQIVESVAEQYSKDSNEDEDENKNVGNDLEENKPKKIASSDDSNVKGKTEVSLLEIGPRFVMTLITILEGSFGGPVIYENKEYVSPNVVRSQIKREQSIKSNARADAVFTTKNTKNVLYKS